MSDSDTRHDSPPHSLSDAGPLVAERAFLHPAWLAALVVLVANDHFFKGAGIIHHVATGKLSDVAGLIVAPVLLAALLRTRSRKGHLASHVAVGGVFALIQMSPTFARLVESIMTQVGVPWRLSADLTDLLTLPALFVSWRLFLPVMAKSIPGRRRIVAFGKLCAGTVGLLACVGTSAVKQPQPIQPPAVQAVHPEANESEPPRSMSSLMGYRWRTSNADGTFQLTYDFRTDGTYVATGQPAWQESGKATVVSADPTSLVLRLSSRRYDGKSDEVVERELVFAADGASFMLNEDRYERIENVASIAMEDDHEQD